MSEGLEGSVCINAATAKTLELALKHYIGLTEKALEKEVGPDIYVNLFKTMKPLISDKARDLQWQLKVAKETVEKLAVTPYCRISRPGVPLKRSVENG